MAGGKNARGMLLFENALDAGRRWEALLTSKQFAKPWALICIVIGLLDASVLSTFLVFIAPYALFGIWWVVWPLTAFAFDLTIGYAWLRLTGQLPSGNDTE